MNAVLLAAGLGTRLRPLTESTPKCMVTIGGVPLIDIWLSSLHRAGFTKFLVNTHHLSKVVETHLQSHALHDLIEISYEHKLLGTAATLRLNSAFCEQGTTLIVHADNLCQCDWNAFLKSHESRPAGTLITMMTFTTADPSSCGIVELDQRGVVQAFHEKQAAPPGNIANAAVYLFEPEVLQILKETVPPVIDISTGLLPLLIGRINTWHNKEIVIDIGTPAELERARKMYLSKEFKRCVNFSSELSDKPLLRDRIISSASWKYVYKSLRYLRPQWFRMLLGTILGILAASFNALMLVSFQLIFSLVLKGDAPMKGMTRRVPILGEVDLQKLFGLADDAEVGLWTVIVACAFIPLLIFLRGFIGFLSMRSYAAASCHILYTIRNDLYKSILRQSLSFFNRSKAGQLIQVVTQQANALQANGLQLVQTLTRHPMTIFSILMVLFGMDWFFTLISLFVFPLCIIPVRIIAKRSQQSGIAETQAGSDMLVCMHEAIGGIRIVKGNAREKYELARFDRANAAMSIDALNFTKLTDLSGTIVETVASLGIAGGLVYWWSQGKTADQFFLLVMALTQMYPPIKELSRISMTMQRTMASTSTIFDLLDQPAEISDATSATILPRIRGEIRFDSVSYAYSGPSGAKLSRYAVTDITACFEPGKFYALVGASGSGKSTLFSLMLRFYDTDKGAISVDGQDIRGVTQESLRENFGVVSQDVFLFHDTIRENIRYGRLDATDEEIYLAARQAHVDDFVQQIPNKYDAIVGDGGANLSGGQKQRIAIARCILRNAPVLLLDEATSALDSESERIIQNSIHDLADGRTVIAIAHRLSTVLAAHQILVMDGGRISDMGTHQQLLDRSLIYRRLYDMQFQRPNSNYESDSA